MALIFEACSKMGNFEVVSLSCPEWHRTHRKYRFHSIYSNIHAFIEDIWLPKIFKLSTVEIENKRRYGNSERLSQALRQSSLYLSYGLLGS